MTLPMAEPGAWLAAGPAYASPHDPASQSTWPLSKASRSPGFGPAPAPSPIRAPRKTGASSLSEVQDLWDLMGSQNNQNYVLHP